MKYNQSVETGEGNAPRVDHVKETMKNNRQSKGGSMSTQQTKVKTIVVEVWRGVVSDVVNIPKGIEVLIQDRDSEEIGGEYFQTLYESDEK